MAVVEAGHCDFPPREALRLTSLASVSFSERRTLDLELDEGGLFAMVEGMTVGLR